MLNGYRKEGRGIFFSKFVTLIEVAMLLFF